jgi:subtilisin family serine protease
MLIRRIFVTAFIATLAAAGVAAAQDVNGAQPAPADHAADGAVQARHFAPYFNDRIELGVDPTMIAVFVDPENEHAADVRAALEEADLAGALVQPSSVPGWSYVMLPDHALGVDAAQQAVDRLAAQGRLDMVSLVYLGTSGLPEIPTRDLLVSFAPDLAADVEAAVLAAHNATVIGRDVAGTPGLVRARTTVATGAAMLEIALEVNDHPMVEWAQSDRIFWAERFNYPNDPLFPQQWALDQPNGEHMDALKAWKVHIGDPSVRVVVLDSGVQQNHPDISQVPGQSFTGSGSNGGPGNACDNHGTAVAGCVSATLNNGIGVAGIAPDVRSQSAKIFNEILFFGICWPFLETQDSWTVAGINWAASSGARVTNSSWGGGASSAITNAFNNTRAQGVLHFAASGNGGGSSISWPASLASVNAVGALNSSGNRAGFSQYGTGLFISAPGENILTTDRTGSAGYSNGDYTTISGTSFASPYAAGVAALILSVDPSLTHDEVEDVMAQTAVDKGTPGYNTDYGWGFVNAGNAVQAVADDDCAPADLNCDGVVNVSDLLILFDNWGACADCGDCPADLNDDCIVNVSDLLVLFDNWGK